MARVVKNLFLLLYLTGLVVLVGLVIVVDLAVQHGRKSPVITNKNPKNEPSTSDVGIDGARMVLIPGGAFQMGIEESRAIFPYEKNFNPVRTVYVDSFYIDVYEVTNAQYRKFIEATGHPLPKYPGPNSEALEREYPHPWNDPRFNAPNQPVVGVSWYDAVAYCQWAGKRLPTEAEWEKAARGKLIGKLYTWGDRKPLCAAYEFCKYEDTPERERSELVDRFGCPPSASPVGDFMPNGYGLYDMAGNVWEWCLNEYKGGPWATSQKVWSTFIQIGVTQPPRYFAVCGGSWRSDADEVRVTARDLLLAHGTYNDVGFRCVKNAP